MIEAAHRSVPGAVAGWRANAPKQRLVLGGRVIALDLQVEWSQVNEMICRVWRGWTTPENAAAYEKIVRGQVIPGIEARIVPGFLHIDLMRRDLGAEVEFQTIMWFADLDAIRAFVGADYEISHVPEEARIVLSRFDVRATHYDVIDRRAQHGGFSQR